jgi:hypothetical protein
VTKNDNISTIKIPINKVVPSDFSIPDYIKNPKYFVPLYKKIGIWIRCLMGFHEVRDIQHFADSSQNVYHTGCPHCKKEWIQYEYNLTRAHRFPWDRHVHDYWSSIGYIIDEAPWVK